MEELEEIELAWGWWLCEENYIRYYTNYLEKGGKEFEEDKSKEEQIELFD